MRVWARAADGTWHLAAETYPNSALSSCCGKWIVSWHFFASGEPPSFATVGELRPQLCPAARR